MIELVFVVIVLMFAMLMFSQTMGSAVKLGDVNQDTRIALDAMRQTIETLDATTDFEDVFALYNDDPADDPFAGAPGANFEVLGLAVADDDVDGMVGEIVFPSDVNSVGLTVVKEDLVDPVLGMPRDLNGDGDVDDEFTDGYRLLPVLVRLRWKGPTGVRVMETVTLLADR